VLRENIPFLSREHFPLKVKLQKALSFRILRWDLKAVSHLKLG